MKTSEAKQALEDAHMAIFKVFHALTQTPPTTPIVIPDITTWLAGARHLIDSVDVGAIAQRKFAEGWDGAVLKLAQLTDEERTEYMKVYMSTNHPDNTTK